MVVKHYLFILEVMQRAFLKRPSFCISGDEYSRAVYYHILV